MKRILFIPILLASLMQTSVQGQDTQTTAQRDSILVEKTQTLLKRITPKWYRKDIEPTVVKKEFSDYEKIHNLYYLPDNVKNGDIFYVVTLYYPKWHEEHFEYKHTGQVYFLGTTLQPFYIHVGPSTEGRG